MADPPNEEGFKVTDRRRRDTAEEPPRPSSPPEPPRARPAEPPPRAAEAPPRPAAAADAALGEPSLVGLFMMLGSSAVVALGETPDPMTGQRHRDLDQAADLVDLLTLLRQRTEGNRTPEESQVLDQLIYDLQLRFVNAQKRP